MRAHASPWLLGAVVFGLLGAACGGGGAESKPPATAASEGAGGAPAGDDATNAEAADAGPTTTTTTLPENGELQGAKLETKSSSSTMEVKTSGPKSDGTSEPGRGREDIQALIVARRDEARKCYDDALKTHPGIEGDLDVKWVIDPKGVVSDISVDDSKSQIHEASVGDCIVAIIKKIKFAESAKGFETRTHYPYNFHPHMGQQQPKSGSK